MTPELEAAIRPFCVGKGQKDSVVGLKETAIYRRVKIYVAKIGRPDIHPHDLRHSFATRLLESGASIREVQELLGHNDLGTTEVYIGVTGEHLQDAISRLNQHTGEKAKLDKSAEILEMLRKLTPEYREEELAKGIQAQVY